MPAVGQEQHEVEQQTDRCCRSGEKPSRNQQPDGDLDERNSDTGQSGMRKGERTQENPPGGAVGKPAQLRADVRQGPGAKEARIAQLLDPGVDEGEA